MKEHLLPAWKELKRTLGWLLISLLCLSLGYYYGRLYEVVKQDNTYFADKMEKGLPINWNGIEYRKVGK